MAGGYFLTPSGMGGTQARLEDLQRQLDQAKAAAGVKSSVLRGDKLTVQDAQRRNISVFGVQYASRTMEGETLEDAMSGVKFFDPATGNILLAAGAYESDGLTYVQFGTLGDVAALDALVGYGNVLRFEAATTLQLVAPTLFLNAPEVQIYSLPTTGSAANLRLDTGSGVPLLHLVSSSERYKTDIADAVVDPREVIALQPRTWVDRGTVDRAPEGDVRRDVGFIAEELDEHPSLRQFVDYDDEGRPDAIQYDRLTVALLAVLKHQDARLNDLEARLAALEGSGDD